MFWEDKTMTEPLYIKPKKSWSWDKRKNVKVAICCTVALKQLSAHHDRVSVIIKALLSLSWYINLTMTHTEPKKVGHCTHIILAVFFHHIPSGFQHSQKNIYYKHIINGEWRHGAGCQERFYLWSKHASWCWFLLWVEDVRC